MCSLLLPTVVSSVIRDRDADTEFSLLHRFFSESPIWTNLSLQKIFAGRSLHETTTAEYVSPQIPFLHLLILEFDLNFSSPTFELLSCLRHLLCPFMFTFPHTDLLPPVRNDSSEYLPVIVRSRAFFSAFSLTSFSLTFHPRRQPCHILRCTLAKQPPGGWDPGGVHGSPWKATGLFGSPSSAEPKIQISREKKEKGPEVLLSPSAIQTFQGSAGHWVSGSWRSAARLTRQPVRTFGLDVGSIVLYFYSPSQT